MHRQLRFQTVPMAAALAAGLVALGCSKAETEQPKEPAPAAKTAPAPAGSEKAPPTALANNPLAEAAGTYEIDSVHSHVVFRIKHLGVAYQYGSFNQVEGSLTLSADPTKSEVQVDIAADSVFTANKKRDTHLKSPDFFDVKQFPTISFKSTKIEPAGGSTYNVTGNLSLHGVTKSVTIPMELTGTGKDPWGGFRVGFEGKLDIDRTDYGITFMPDGLGNEVNLMLTVEAIKK